MAANRLPYFPCCMASEKYGRRFAGIGDYLTCAPLHYRNLIRHGELPRCGEACFSIGSLASRWHREGTHALERDFRVAPKENASYDAERSAGDEGISLGRTT